MSNIKLEVGKTYRNWRGEKVTIVWRNEDEKFSCLGDDTYYYAEDGSFLPDSREHPNDLIEEVTIPDENKKRNKMGILKLEVGKTYRCRNGNKVKIIGKINSTWPFVGDNEELYDEQGWYYLAKSDDPKDLIEEIGKEGK